MNQKDTDLNGDSDTSFVILNNLCKLSEPRFPYLYDRDYNIISSVTVECNLGSGVLGPACT